LAVDPVETQIPRALVATWVPAAWTVAALALLAELARPANPDLAGFMYCADRVLHGERLYVDLLESNPPAVIFAGLDCVVPVAPKIEPCDWRVRF
jgi:hypothetical protein